MNNAKHFLPNRFVLIVFGLFALGFISYGIFYAYQEKKKKNQEPEKEFVDVTLVEDTVPKELFIDTDGDGAYDWVERLWPELDPENPDSDGDGVLDGKYIEQKKRIMDKERLGGVDIASTLTESEKLGRSVYTALFAIEQSGGVIDAETQEQISENVVKYISDLSLGSKTYIRGELELVADNKQNSYAYRDEMKKFLKLNPIQVSEINLFMKSLEDPKEYMNEIEEAAIKYDTYVNTLSAMKVPYAVAGRHTELLNAAGQIEGALKNLTLEEYDEIVVLSSLVQIEKTLNSIVDASVHIEKYFDIISDPSIFDDKVSIEE